MKVFMFHYVKPFSNYYHFDLDLFEKAVKYLTNNYKVISLKEFDYIVKNGQNLSDEYVMLTFDDGTIDHYKYVYPVLKKYKCSGLFFLSSCIASNKMLDIQIIHQLLEKIPIDLLFDDLKEQLLKVNISIENFKAEKSLDIGKMALFKQLLQFKLPRDIRNSLLEYFSKKYNISLNVNENYIGINEIMRMKNDNMYFGIHTYSHPRLALLSKKEQEYEIKENMDYLLKNKIIEGNLLSIAFPYGSYNYDTLDIMKDMNIKYGFKADNFKSNISMEKNLIDRIDCNVLIEVVN